MPNCTNAPSAIFWLLSAIAACRCAHSIHRPTKRRRRLLKKLRRNARSKTPRSYQRKAARNLVPGRGAHWPARHADPCLGQTRDAPPCAARSAYEWAYIFGAVCPQRRTTVALVAPTANTEVMSMHLKEIGDNVAPGAHAALVLEALDII